jgi:hypothetical protein
MIISRLQRGAVDVADTSPLDSPLEAYPGYRLEAKGREAAEDERLNSWSRCLIRAPASGASS